MCGLLDIYVVEFSTLECGKDADRWPELSLHHSPAVPFLLLSILDQIADGEIVRNFISPTAEIVATYEGYMDLLPDHAAKVSLASPFYQLKDSSFWILKPRRDKYPEPSSIDELRDNYYGAEIQKELFVLLQMATHRNKLRQRLISSYFSSRFQKVIYGVAQG